MIPATRYFGILLAVSKLATSQEPLASKTFAYPNGIPYQVSGSNAGPRGPQSGYNRCNSTTEGPNSQCQVSYLATTVSNTFSFLLDHCQTLILNSIDDFCMWSSNLNTGTDTIPEGEAREVAWCTKHGHGSRIIPEGTFTGVQWLYAKNYLQVVGYLDQTKVGLKADDDGGGKSNQEYVRPVMIKVVAELDPHGDDEQGNPLGGIVYTNGFGMNAAKYAQQLQTNSTPSNQFTQVVEWVDFIGTGMFCLKMCNPSDKQGDRLCDHRYDRVGCTYNAGADYAHIKGTYQVCDSDDMIAPGQYVSNGVTTTWKQGPENQPVNPPYSPKIPASSNCRTFSSEQLFGTASPSSSSSVPASTTGTSSNANPTASGGTEPGQSASGGSGSRSDSGASPTQTGAGISSFVLPSTSGVVMVFVLVALFA